MVLHGSQGRSGTATSPRRPRRPSPRRGIAAWGTKAPPPVPSGGPLTPDPQRLTRFFIRRSPFSQLNSISIFSITITLPRPACCCTARHCTDHPSSTAISPHCEIPHPTTPRIYTILIYLIVAPFYTLLFARPSILRCDPPHLGRILPTILSSQPHVARVVVVCARPLLLLQHRRPRDRCGDDPSSRPL